MIETYYPPVAKHYDDYLQENIEDDMPRSSISNFSYFTTIWGKRVFFLLDMPLKSSRNTKITIVMNTIITMHTAYGNLMKPLFNSKAILT